MAIDRDIGTPRPRSGKTTYHRDGTVTLWDTVLGGWVRAREFRGETLMTLSPAERERVLRHTGQDS